MPADDVPGGGPLDARIRALEEYVVRNDARISALEKAAARVIAERGAQIDRLKDETRRIRWDLRRRRG